MAGPCIQGSKGKVLFRLMNCQRRNSGPKRIDQTLIPRGCYPHYSCLMSSMLLRSVVNVTPVCRSQNIQCCRKLLCYVTSNSKAGDLHILVNKEMQLGTIGYQTKRGVSRLSSSKSASHYYDILGLKPCATQNQIKTAYYQMSKQHHPDVSERQNSHSLFTEINEAYEVLGNLRKRRMYDRGLYSSQTVHQRADNTREETEDNEDYTQAYHNSNFKRGSRPPPPRGRTKIYNFDEFYRQHYNDMRERKATEFKEYKRHQDRMFEEGRIKSTNFAINVLVLLWMFAAVSLMILRRENYDRDVVGKKKTPGTIYGGNIVASSPRSKD